jgi:LmbE family N-acetylglucosaminyl deacetylase
MNKFTRKYLIITAHPDDLEMGCGGLVSRVIKEGGSVTNLLLVKPSAEHNHKRDKDIVKSELEKSKSLLKVNTIIYDTPLHSNGRPNLTLTNNLISYAESCIEDQDILISHWREDHHQDHRVCYDVARSISRKHFEQFWCMDEPPYNLHYKNFNCNQYVDITGYTEEKRKALQSYKTYFTSDSIETILNYNRYRGSFLGAGKLAETFQIMYNKIS